MIIKKEAIGLIIMALIFIVGAFFIFRENIKICNDGTLYDVCSEIKPYFCSEGRLIKNATLCGCGTLKIKDGDCFSGYQTEPKNITLNYVLRGEKGKINFTVYKNMSDYLSKLPRYLDSKDNPTLLDFKLRFVNEEQQKPLLLPLVVAIQEKTADKEDQARIAISIVQSIPFGSSNKTLQFVNDQTAYQRYPYEVLYDMQGICSEKSELLIFLLREIGYGAASLYYVAENHEAVGIACQKEKNFNGTEYCFIETTGPSIITDDKTEYFGLRKLGSTPEIYVISRGISLGKNVYEYKDAKTLMSIRGEMQRYGTINFLQHFQFQSLKKTYGLVDPNEYVF